MAERQRLRREGPGPGAGPWGGPPRGGLRLQYNSVALQVYRPSLGRWATVAKLVLLGGELVLAVPYRHRPRLEGRVSLPLVALRYAQERGATAVIVRYDDERLAYRL